MAYPNTNTKPKKLRVIEALKTTLETITGSGFKHTIKRVHLFDGDEVVLGDSMPAIVIIPESGDESDTRLMCGAVEHYVRVTCTIASRVTPGSTQYKEDLHWLVADVTKALEADSQLGGEAVSALISEDQVYDVGSNEPVAVAEVRVDIRYRHTVGDPSA